jgi:tellurite resistance-related uncharacterized protein
VIDTGEDPRSPAALPAALARSHRTAVWAMLCVEDGSVRYITSIWKESFPRDMRVGAGDSAVIRPGVEHRVEPSTDARFFVQFYREPDADVIRRGEPPPAETRHRSGPWEHRGRDLDTGGEIFEMVTRQYVDVVKTTSSSRTSTSGPATSTGRPTSVPSPTTGATCSCSPRCEATGCDRRSRLDCRQGRVAHTRIVQHRRPGVRQLGRAQGVGSRRGPRS